MSKIGKIFKKLVDPFGIVLKKKSKNKAVFQAIAAKSAADKKAGVIPKQGSEAEVAQRREQTAARLRSGRVTALAKDDEEEDKIKRPGVRRAKLLGS